MTGYNGYTNYETFTVKLYIDNTVAQYHHWNREAEALWVNNRDPAIAASNTVRLLLADRLKETFDCTDYMKIEGVYQSLLTAALEKVNWIEIADDILEDYCPGYKPRKKEHRNEDHPKNDHT